MTGIVILNVVELTTGENYIRWTKKDGTEKEVMYYSCSRNKMKRVGFCDYSANLTKENGYRTACCGCSKTNYES